MTSQLVIFRAFLFIFFHPLGMIQVKKDSSNKIMLRSEGEISDGVGMCLEIG